MNLFKTLLPILMFLVTCYGCQSSSEEEEIMTPLTKCDPEISYKNVIRPIIDNKCGNCHLDGSQAPDLTTYSSVKLNASKIRSQTQSGNMPKDGSLTKSQKDAIACWVDSGALNN